MAKTYDAEVLRQAAYRKTWHKHSLRVRLRPMLEFIRHYSRVVSHPFCRHATGWEHYWTMDDSGYSWILGYTCKACDRYSPLRFPKRVKRTEG